MNGVVNRPDKADVKAVVCCRPYAERSYYFLAPPETYRSLTMLDVTLRNGS